MASIFIDISFRASLIRLHNIWRVFKLKFGASKRYSLNEVSKSFQICTRSSCNLNTSLICLLSSSLSNSESLLFVCVYQKENFFIILIKNKFRKKNKYWKFSQKKFCVLLHLQIWPTFKSILIAFKSELNSSLESVVILNKVVWLVFIRIKQKETSSKRKINLSINKK